MSPRKAAQPTEINVKWGVLPWIVLALALIFSVLTIIYALSLKQDIVTMRTTTQKLLATSTQQRDVAKEQLKINTETLEVSKQQLDVSKRTLSVAEQQLSVSTQTLQVARSTDAKLNTSLGIQRQLLQTAQATLQEAREINRKTPSAGATSNSLLGQ